MAGAAPLPEPKADVLAATEGRKIPRPARATAETNAAALEEAKGLLHNLIREIDNTNPNRMPIQFHKKQDWMLTAMGIQKLLGSIKL